MGKPPEFDPLNAWLGIPVSEQPPTLYALLGVARFEADQGVIEEAYHQRYRLVRKYEVGPREHAAGTLLDELSRAYRILSKSDLKVTYDQQLEASLDVVSTNKQSVDEISDALPVVDTVLKTDPMARDIVEATCPNPTCGAPFQIRKEWAGFVANCKKCNARLSIGADLIPTRVTETRPARKTAIDSQADPVIDGDDDEEIVEASLVEPPVVLEATLVGELQQTSIAFCPDENCLAPILIKSGWVGSFVQCTSCLAPFEVTADLSLDSVSDISPDSVQVVDDVDLLTPTPSRSPPRPKPNPGRTDTRWQMEPGATFPSGHEALRVDESPNIPRRVGSNIQKSTTSKVTPNIFETTCPNPSCQAKFLLRSDWVGQAANCKTCGAKIVIGKNLIPKLVSDTPTLSETSTDTEVS